MKKTPPFERVAQFAAAIRGQYDVGRFFCLNRAELRNGNLKLSKQLEQKRFECFVRSINFIDQQDRRFYFGKDRLQERALKKEIGPEDIVLLFLDRFVAALLNLDGQKLLLIVPLVDRRIQIQSFVTLEPDQFCLQRGRQCLGGLRFSYSGVPL